MLRYTLPVLLGLAACGDPFGNPARFDLTTSCDRAPVVVVEAYIWSRPLATMTGQTTLSPDDTVTLTATVPRADDYWITINWYHLVSVEPYFDQRLLASVDDTVHVPGTLVMSCPG